MNSSGGVELSRGQRALRIVSNAGEVGWRELIRDVRTAWTWQGPADDLVVRICRDHTWPAELTVGYLAALQRVRRSNLPTVAGRASWRCRP
jgi:hypothetical protein